MNKKNRRKRILFDLKVNNSRWIGGIYYLRNIIFQMLQNDYIRSNYLPVIICSDNYSYLFDRFEKDIVIFSYNNKTKRLWLSIKNVLRCNYIYNYAGYRFDPFDLLHSKAIYWIPDFQHKYYPDYFAGNDINERDAKGGKIATDNRPLVLSSNSCLSDFKQFFSEEKKEVYVIPFVSCIDKDVRSLSEKQETNVLKTNGIYNSKYVVVMNQFWQHKNHIVVLEAIKRLTETRSDYKMLFVFTGKFEDYRNPEYIEQLKEIINNPVVSPYIRILGFIDRADQIAIMKNAEFIIQPSLFEGWGTVVEDAKVLDKTILLSDIPVHREQMNDKCILFAPHDPVALAELIYEESQKEHNDDVEKGIADMHNRAKEYSKGFEQMLRDLENMK